ncbi:MAG: hypothetical protein ACI8TV_001517, partial [Porticoccaceae bacterium]
MQNSNKERQLGAFCVSGIHNFYIEVPYVDE